MSALLRLLVAALLAASFCEVAVAAPAKRRNAPARKTVSRGSGGVVQSRFRKSPYVGAISIDADTGRVYFSRNADVQGYPASVTKLMTAFIVLDDIKAGRLSLDDRVVASPVRTKRDDHLRQPSSLGLKAGQSMSVDEMLKAIMVKSANDAAIFLAERCSGSMEKFVARMNEKARSLGMTSTRFYNPNGLPPYKRGGSDDFNISTCRDLAKMSRALIKEHPEILKYTSLKKCCLEVPGQGRLEFTNHNNVMAEKDLNVINPDGTEAVDGLKTGFISAGGYSLALTGKRNGKRVIVVVLGSSTARERDNAARARLDDLLTALDF